MSNIKPRASGKDPPLSNRQLEEQDIVDNLVIDNEIEGVEAFVANACVKMKLNTFSVNKQINTRLRNVVLDMNQVLGEAYAFANFHLLRIMDASPDIVVPKIDRNFYYRCLVAVSVNKSRDTTLSDELQASKKRFDALRESNVPKVKTIGQSQMIADLSISMATMATNHLWMNIQKRLQRFLSWSQPALKLPMRKRIVASVLFKPTVALSKLFPNKDIHEQAGLAVATELRGILELPSSGQYASRAHLLIPLYFHILKVTVAAKKVWIDAKKVKKFGGRVFTLLPMKNGYTISHIQFSAMTLLGYMKELKLEQFEGDGRKEDASRILRKYFNVNLVETKNRRFGNRIITDGVAVSVLMNKKSALVCPNSCPSEKKLQELYVRSLCDRSDSEHVRIASVDPGYTDVVTGIDQYGNINSYSSAKYYEMALYNMSRRRTDKWNQGTVLLTATIPPPETDSLTEFEEFARPYLKNLRVILQHRCDKGYRNMRFLRYKKKQVAIRDICEMIAPRGELSVVGFGDWNGGNGTPIKRRCAGPLQEIKLYLAKMKDVVLMSIDEYNTSKKCSDCGHELCNMKASRVTYRKVDGTRVKVVRDIEKIHKILHCKSRQAGTSSSTETPRCGTTWNRDVNASKNILKLTILQMQGLPRPVALRRQTAANQ
jgi:hypothetical protein